MIKFLKPLKQIKINIKNKIYLFKKQLKVEQIRQVCELTNVFESRFI